MLLSRFPAVSLPILLFLLMLLCCFFSDSGKCLPGRAPGSILLHKNDEYVHGLVSGVCFLHKNGLFVHG